MSSTGPASSVQLQQRSRQQLPQLASPYIEPVPFDISQNQVFQDARVVQQHLEPVDCGAAAWKLLGAAFIFEALFWGKISTTNPFGGLKNLIANPIFFSRLSPFFWGFSELLLWSAAVCRQSIHSYCRYCSFRNLLPWSTACDSFN